MSAFNSQASVGQNVRYGRRAELKGTVQDTQQTVRVADVAG
jgi:hypothetical protein